MTYILTFIILVILIWHFNSKGEVERGIAKDGGMVKKYHILIEHIEYLVPSFDINKLNKTSITLSRSNKAAIEQFIISQQLDRVHIIWEFSSVIHGRHRLDWTFNDRIAQEIIFEKILNDIMSYQNNI